jgi:Predicted choloylglycine hydrolase
MQDEHTRLAQNWDWVGSQRAHLLLLSISAGEQPAALILTEAGMLGKIGVNQLGLAIGLNILRATNDGQKLGVPVHAFQRAALACEDVQAVVELAQGLSFASSSNAMLADAKGNVASLEYNPAGAAVVAAEDGVVAHSNHFLSETLAKWQAPLTASVTSEPRLACARSRIAAWPRRIDLAHLEALLRDQTEGACIAREPDPALPPAQRIETVCGVIIDCQAQSLSIAPDVPTRAAFTTITRAT